MNSRRRLFVLGCITATVVAVIAIALYVRSHNRPRLAYDDAIYDLVTKWVAANSAVVEAAGNISRIAWLYNDDYEPGAKPNPGCTLTVVSGDGTSIFQARFIVAVDENKKPTRLLSSRYCYLLGSTRRSIDTREYGRMFEYDAVDFEDEREALRVLDGMKNAVNAAELATSIVGGTRLVARMSSPIDPIQGERTVD